MAIRKIGVLSVVALSLLAWGCGPSSPTAPSPTPSPEVPAYFVIVAGMNVLTVGQTTPFVAMTYPPLGPHTHDPPIDVTRRASWVSSDTSVATVGADGRVTARGPGISEITATYRGTYALPPKSCSVTPSLNPSIPCTSYTLPLVVGGRGSSEALSSFVGTWSGMGVHTCEDMYGFVKSGPYGFCVWFSQIVPMQLTLSAGGDILTGTMTVYQDGDTAVVQAALTDSGQLAIGGTLRSGEGGGGIGQVRESRLTLTRRGQLAGTMIQDLWYENIYGSVLEREYLQLDGLVRQ
jgi:hypothetical protein